jgi:hypothetical protein
MLLPRLDQVTEVNALVKDPIPYLLILKDAGHSLVRVAGAMKEVLQKTALKPAPPEKLAESLVLNRSRRRRSGT